jgi:Fe-S-cluster-containing hydrogenase component 2
MDAIHIDNGKAFHDPDRCIGCGLCVSTCPTDSFSLQRKTKAEQPYVPGTLFETYVKLGRLRGTLKISGLINMKIRSTIDRLKTSKL